jgi:hypothetical protein
MSLYSLSLSKVNVTHMSLYVYLSVSEVQLKSDLIVIIIHELRYY